MREAAGDAMTGDRRPIAVLVDREGLGDALLKAPFLRALRRAFPEREVWWIATHQTAMADALRAMFSQDIAQVIAYAGLNGRVSEVLARLRALPAFAQVFDARTKIAAVALARYGLRHRGFYCCLPGFLLCDGPHPRRTRPRHIAERMLSLIGPAAGRPPDPSGWLTPTEEARAASERLLPSGPAYVGIAPGSREAAKNWPLEGFLELARALGAAGAVPVFLLGPMEGAVEARIEAAAPGALVLRSEGADQAPGDSLDLLVAKGQRLSLLVANDNGVGHLVGGAGTPVLSLFGPTDPRRWAPVAPANRILRAQDFGAAEIGAIPARAVVEAAMEMLERPAEARPAVSLRPP
ncbi:MAG: glycosyltransferase family 9 protein [Caulobacteraceae bacterium]|nr:glycosyltransferase family 9 protein [Caulobacteraceae bacterium]